jgi:hypothetical protein
MENIETETLVEEVAIQKPKRQLTDKQKEATSANLAKGRAIRDEKRKLQKEEDQKKINELVVRKAEKLVKIQVRKDKELKSMLGPVDDDEVEVEERIIIKPKRKKIIYREESDSEEEVVVKKKKPVIPVNVPKETLVVPVVKARPSILFY